ncbi:von Willebrand factor D and EGF domain-containing protein isoform X2 [Patella vulgata]|uniref:von Willebrand factor D and EGF domain-containing protein isoform X2 n=1 Tax=Patella vulgata TaxID=6465 RepID=UPI0024A8B6C6|nr:von Willebrand factor D and EGF domain-containing protein isoform X2 [Patella vulgata]
METEGNEFKFVCNFVASTKPAHNDIWYTVTWYVNNKLIKTVDPFQKSADMQTKTLLIGTEIKAAGIKTVGFQIRCGYTVSKTVDSTPSPVTDSSNRFIGIEILTPTVYVKDGEDAIITVRATAPIGCFDALPCELEVNLLKVKDNDDCALSPSFSRCGFKIKGTKWHANYSITLRGSLPGLNANPVAVTFVHLKTVEDYFPQQIWGNQTIGTVKVVVSQDTTPIKGKECHAVCDPHIKTFFGTPYEHHYKGVFTLYENKAWKQEIQIQTKPCGPGSRVTCVCGIAIRVGREVYRREHCSDKFWKSGYAQCDGPTRIDVRQHSATQHKIRLPSSTTIKLVTTGSFLNVYVNPSVADKDRAQGLCGQITTNTFIGRDKEVSNYQWSGMPRFSESWGVESTIDLFSDKIENLLGAKGNLFLCKCDETKLTQIVCKSSQKCEPKDIYDYTSIKGCETTYIAKRSVGYHYRVPRSVRNPYRVPRSSEQLHISKRQAAYPVWINGWTERSATDYCTSLLKNSSTVQICSNTVATDIQGPLENCVLDIKLVGNTAFALVALETIKTSCFHEVSYDTRFQQSTTNQPSIFDQIKLVACPSECSHHGTCNQGLCDCNEGYGSLDCSISLKIPPLIYYPPNCRNTNYGGECTQLRLLGGDFLDSAALVCKLLIFEDRNRTSTLISNITVSATYVSENEVICPDGLTTAHVVYSANRRYRYINVSVSNNRRIFSEPLVFYPAIVKRHSRSKVVVGVRK